MQYRFTFIPEMEGGRSAIVLKCHHSFTDGMGLSTLWLAFSGDYEPKSLPTVRQLSCWKKIMLDLISPFIVIWYMAIKLGCLKVDKNEIKKAGIPASGIKSGAYRYDFNVQSMKKYCKANKCSINDYTTALLSCTLYEYFE